MFSSYIICFQNEKKPNQDNNDASDSDDDSWIDVSHSEGEIGTDEESDTEETHPVEDLEKNNLVSNKKDAEENVLKNSDNSTKEEEIKVSNLV